MVTNMTYSTTLLKGKHCRMLIQCNLVRAFVALTGTRTIGTEGKYQNPETK